MKNGDVSHGRRRFLVGATAAVGGVGIVGAAVPFVASWNPSAKAEAAGAPVTVNIEKIEPGQQITVEWRGTPVWIIRRTTEMLDNIETYANDVFRSINPEYAVLVGLCTHLGCVPSYRPEVAPSDLGEDWLGGLFCPCHGSRYDMAGRVYDAQPAPLNLVVPPHRYDDDMTLTLGLDPEVA
jgi:ubiquinol-cytochrome c reductase iron-sulfur subunit